MFLRDLAQSCCARVQSCLHQQTGALTGFFGGYHWWDLLGDSEAPRGNHRCKEMDHSCDRRATPHRVTFPAELLNRVSCVINGKKSFPVLNRAHLL